jgi:hypothetical protein
MAGAFDAYLLWDTVQKFGCIINCGMGACCSVSKRIEKRGQVPADLNNSLLNNSAIVLNNCVHISLSRIQYGPPIPQDVPNRQRVEDPREEDMS